jgi:hypothetical protein
MVNSRPVLQHIRVLPKATVTVLEELENVQDENLYMQYYSNDLAKYDLHDDKPFYLMDPSGTGPGRYLLISCGFGRAHISDQVSQNFFAKK